MSSTSASIVEIFSPQGTNPIKKRKGPKSSQPQRSYSKSAKSYVVTLSSRSAKLTIPHDVNLSQPSGTASTKPMMRMSSSNAPALNIFSRYLVLQLNATYLKLNPHIELTIFAKASSATQQPDSNRRLRLIFSGSFKHVSVKEMFHVQIPLSFDKLLAANTNNENHNINAASLSHQYNKWYNLCFDMFDLYQSAFKNASPSSYHCLSTILLSGPKCHLRKVFAMDKDPIEDVFLPKKVQFVNSVDFGMCKVDSTMYGGADEDSTSPPQKKSPSVHSRQSPSHPNYAFGSTYASNNNDISARSQRPTRAKSVNAHASVKRRSPSMHPNGQQEARIPARQRNVHSASSRPIRKQNGGPRTFKRSQSVTGSSRSNNALRVSGRSPPDNTRYVRKEQTVASPPRSHSVSAIGKNKQAYNASKYQDEENDSSTIKLPNTRRTYSNASQGSSTNSSRSNQDSARSNRFFEALQVLEEQDQSLTDQKQNLLQGSFHQTPNMSPASPPSASNKKQGHPAMDDVPEMRSPVFSHSPAPPDEEWDDDHSFSSDDDDDPNDPTDIPPVMSPAGKEKPSRSSRVLFSSEEKQVDDNHLDIGPPQRSVSPTGGNSSIYSSDTDEEFPIHRSGSKYDVDSQDQQTEEADAQKVSLLFDPLFQCYYDPKSNKYYEAKDVTL